MLKRISRSVDNLQYKYLCYKPPTFYKPPLYYKPLAGRIINTVCSSIHSFCLASMLNSGHRKITIVTELRK